MNLSSRPFLALLLAAAPLAAQDPPKKQLLRLSFQPGTSHFHRLTIETLTKVKAGEKVLTAVMTMEQVVETKCVSVKDGKALIEQTARRLSIKSTGAVRIDYDSDVEGSDPGMMRNAVDMVGQKITMRMDERGNLSDVDVPEAFAAMGLFGSGGVEQMLAQAMPPLPEAAVAIGDTWETEAEMLMGKLGKGQLKIVNKVTAVEKGSVRIEQQMQVDLGKVDPTSAGKMQPGKCAGSTVIDLATGSNRESDMVSAMSTTGGMSTEMVTTTKMRSIDAPPAKQTPSKQPVKAETGKGG